MEENLGLFCAENSNTCFGDFDCNATLDSEMSSSWHKQDNQNHNQEPSFNGLICFPILSEDRVREMVEREIKHLPKHDYLWRLRSSDLDLSTRREAVDWIFKSQTRYRFGAFCACLSMNYLDRFLSVYQLPRGKPWAVQLLSVACLSLAAKMEEINMPPSVDLQAGEPKFVFEAKTIQRMELLVLNTFNWRMQAITPYSFLDYFLIKINGNQNLPNSLITRSLQLISNIIKGIEFLEFRPSEIAAAVAISVSGEDQAVLLPGFTHVVKERVMKIIELIRDLSKKNGDKVGSGSESPNGVLEAACLCLSCKSDDITVGSCTNSSSHNNNDYSITVQALREGSKPNKPTPFQNNS